LPTVVRAVISEKEGGDGEKELAVEGYGLLQVMTTDGIIGRLTTSNHIMEVAQVLGIEAAR
jgi:DNA-directed RNA polymerase III subunit RPC1